MHENALRPGDHVTVRRGAATLPENRSTRRLAEDVRGKVIRVEGRSVQVEADHGWKDEGGLSLSGKFLTFDRSYVYLRDEA